MYRWSKAGLFIAGLLPWLGGATAIALKWTSAQGCQQIERGSRETLFRPLTLSAGLKTPTRRPGENGANRPDAARAEASGISPTAHPKEGFPPKTGVMDDGAMGTKK